MLGYILLAIGLIAGAIGLLLYTNRKRKMVELRQKTQTAVKGGQILRVEWTSDGPLGEVAESFNVLGTKLEQLQKENQTLKDRFSGHEQLKSKVEDMASSISNIGMLTETGKQIAASLKLEDVFRQLFKQIYASLPSRELAVLMKDSDGLHRFHINEKGVLESKISEDVDVKQQDILLWCYHNNDVAFLNDAVSEFGQFLFSAPIMHDGQPVKSLYALPLNRGEDIIGSLAVYSDRQNAFENHHLEMIASLASYSGLAMVNAGLFGQVEEERKKSDVLLRNILPEEVAEELKEKGKAEARYYEQVTVLFTDFVNFTRISEQFSANELVSEIDYYFRAFDKIMLKYGIEKIKTIGDAYMAVSGLPVKAEDHAEKCVKAAIEILEFVNTNQQDGHPLHIRIGLNSGPVVAGVVGLSKYAFDIWGDTVNTAARMEQNSEAGKINISGATYALVKDNFKVISRGKISAKNKGDIEMYFIDEN